MSYYQKYRPKKISELNLRSVKDSLGSVLKSGKVSHAYLFVGPRGSGKTSAARILSQVVNCLENVSKESDLAEPCGKCASCKNLQNNSVVDVIEIDAASNGLVDDIRDLREKVRLSPVLLSKKVYIIDEVHMVSTAGFNALLKTLEEPPAHAMFILCTTEAHKVPETIVSRCTRIGFSRATEEELIDSLHRVIDGEKLAVSETALPALAQVADGSFREAHKLLEQLAGFGVEITDSLVVEKLGGASKVLIKMAVEASLSHDSAKVIEVFEELENGSSKATIVLSMLITYLKQQMSVAVKSGANVQEILKMMNLLVESSEKIKYSPEPLLPLEIALLEISLNGIAGSGGSSKKAVSEDRVNIPNTKINVSVSTVDDVASCQPNVIEGELKQALVNLEVVRSGWHKFLDGFAVNNGSLAGLLRNCEPKVVEGESLIVEVKSRFQKDMLERDVKRKVIEAELEKIWGPISLKTVLQEGQARTEPIDEDANVMVTSVDAEKIFS